MRVTYTGLTHQMVVGKLEVAGRPMKATGSRRDDSKLLTRREGGMWTLRNLPTSL